MPEDTEVGCIMGFLFEQTKITRGRPEARSDARIFKANVQNFMFYLLALT